MFTSEHFFSPFVVSTQFSGLSVQKRTLPVIRARINFGPFSRRGEALTLASAKKSKFEAHGLKKSPFHAYHKPLFSVFQTRIKPHTYRMVCYHLPVLL